MENQENSDKTKLNIVELPKQKDKEEEKCTKFSCKSKLWEERERTWKANHKFYDMEDKLRSIPQLESVIETQSLLIQEMRTELDCISSLCKSRIEKFNVPLSNKPTPSQMF